jgi:hypothetical protein
MTASEIWQNIVNDLETIGQGQYGFYLQGDRMKNDSTPSEERAKIEKRFCSYCGKQMITYLRPAEENEIWLYPGDVKTIYAYPYDSKTGKRNYCPYWICPDYKVKKWYQIFSPHDSYFENKVVSGGIK